MRAITATVTPAQPTAMVRMDNFATAVLGGQIVCSGGGAFTLFHSCDDPNDLVNPVPVGSMTWDNSLLPPAAQSGSASTSFQIMASPLWFQLNLTAGTSQWSASDAAVNGMTLSNGGLTVTPFGSAWGTIRTTTGKLAGNLYVEFSNSVSASTANIVFGCASSGFISTSYLGTSNYSGGIAITSGGNYVSSGFINNNVIQSTPIVPAAGEVWALAIDFSAGNIWLARNNVWLNLGNPATGSLPSISFVPATVGTLFAGLSLDGAGTGVWTLRATAASQTYAPPTGFSAWDSGTTMAVEAAEPQLVAAQAAEPRAGVGSVRATFLQVGEHSHSNISKGPFAPPKLADETKPGTNFGAMPK